LEEKKEEQKQVSEEEQKERELFGWLMEISGTVALERGLVKYPKAEPEKPIFPLSISKQIIIYIMSRVGMEEVKSGYHRTRKPYDLSKIWEWLKPDLRWVKNPMAFLTTLFNQEKDFMFVEEFEITPNPKTKHKEIIFTLNDSYWIKTGRLPKEVFVKFDALKPDTV